MVEPLRHRQTKEAATAMFNLQPPRHISTLHEVWVPLEVDYDCYRIRSGPNGDESFEGII
jgi:hypothetical protein